MHLTDAELRDLYVRSTGERREKLRAELTRRTRMAIVRAMPLPEGTCGHGRRVYADVKGAYSSGWVCHSDDHGGCNGGAGLDVIWDVKPKKVRLKAELDRLPLARLPQR